MNFLKKIDIATNILKSIIFRKKFPLIVTWNCTFRCNLKCKYCGSWKKKKNEISTLESMHMIEELVGLGAKFIKFNGGEPLLRDDLSEIIDFCKEKKMFVSVNSNGTLINEKFQKIKKIDEIQLSLDGPPSIHDFIRGKGAYDKVIEAINICKDSNIRVGLTTVISKYNVFYPNQILNIANRLKVKVEFQPVCQEGSTYSNENIRLLFSPKEYDYKQFILFLLKEKKKGNANIGNSYSGLRHLYNWPISKRVPCLLRFIHCHIEPDGSMVICNGFKNYQKYLVPLRKNYKESFDKISLPFPCYGCWCNTIEYNLCFGLKIDSIVNLWKRIN